MQVITTRRYLDTQLQRNVREGEILEVSEERAKTLQEVGVAKPVSGLPLEEVQTPKLDLTPPLKTPRELGLETSTEQESEPQTTEEKPAKAKSKRKTTKKKVLVTPEIKTNGKTKRSYKGRGKKK